MGALLLQPSPAPLPHGQPQASEESHTAPRSPGIPQHCLRKKITWPSRAEALAVAARDTRPVYSPVLGGVGRYTGNSRGLPGPSPRLLSPAQTPSPLSAPHAPAPGAPHSRPQDAHDSQSPELLDKQDHRIIQTAALPPLEASLEQKCPSPQKLPPLGVSAVLLRTALGRGAIPQAPTKPLSLLGARPAVLPSLVWPRQGLYSHGI